jgi:hypothetical protein
VLGTVDRSGFALAFHLRTPVELRGERLITVKMSALSIDPPGLA